MTRKRYDIVGHITDTHKIPLFNNNKTILENKH